MSGRYHRPERIIAAATALALQAALYLLLIPPRPPSRGARSPPALMAMLLTATRPKPVRGVAPYPLKSRARRRVIQHLVVRPIALPEPRERASGSAVDWQAAIQQEVGTELSHAGAPPAVRMGLPRMPATQAPGPSFGWDEARIHRRQRLEHGIIDVGRCVIRLAFPIPLCHFGRAPANGDLFKHMRDPHTAPDSLP